MLRSGRFRHRLLDDDFLNQHAGAIHKCLQPFLRLWQEKKLFDYEMATLYVLIFAVFRRPQDFLGGRIQELSPFQGSSSLPLSSLYDLLETSLPETLQQNKGLKKIFAADNLIDGFARHSWRSIPLSANRSLWAWAQGRYRLQLRQDIPRPEEVLRMQAQGTRCVSILSEPSQIQSFVEEGRDAWGFLIHDLIHADHFFLNPQKAQAQIFFSQKLELLLRKPKIQDMLLKDTAFKTEFHYLMSDMNSVPLHLLKTFKAILLGYFKRNEKCDFHENLPPEAEKAFEDFFQGALQVWDFPRQAIQAAIRLNTPHYRGQPDSLLLDSFLTLNSVTKSQKDDIV